ncbi:hypothetical protein HJG60_010410 [Phyllostomus discolor]|uniref:Uncharacterized protein n=1 Tax=Phyllostomus discolor TaxID=89673 RepID=A0A834AWV2_9CHIR|nr:hypothetical protein HJG60_010410 [Phyllostomus discolor]
MLPPSRAAESAPPPGDPASECCPPWCALTARLGSCRRGLWHRSRRPSTSSLVSGRLCVPSVPVFPKNLPPRDEAAAGHLGVVPLRTPPPATSRLLCSGTHSLLCLAPRPPPPPPHGARLPRGVSPSAALAVQPSRSCVGVGETGAGRGVSASVSRDTSVLLESFPGSPAEAPPGPAALGSGHRLR